MDAGPAQGGEACGGGTVQGTDAILLIDTPAGAGDPTHYATIPIFKGFGNSLAGNRLFYEIRSPNLCALLRIAAHRKNGM